MIISSGFNSFFSSGFVSGFNSFYHEAESYCKKIPADTLEQAGYAFGITFAIETVLSTPLVKAAAIGGLSFVATIIHGLVTPLFKRYIEDSNRPLTIGEEMLRTSLPLLVGASFVAVATDYHSGLQALWITALTELVSLCFPFSEASTLEHTRRIIMIV